MTEPTGNDYEILLLAEEAALSTAKSSSMYFEEHFSRPWVSIHAEFFQIVDGFRAPGGANVKRKALAAPRGFGKSTILGLGKLGKDAIYGLKKFIIIVSNTKDQAIEHLSTFKTEIESNEYIQAVHGDLKGTIWREDRIELSNGVYIMARGAGQQLRGLKHGFTRPDLILCDDLESDEQVENEDRRKKFKRWFYTDLLRSGVDTGKNCEVIVIGTILHQDSLLQNLLDADEWWSVVLEAFDENLVPTYEDYLNAKEVQALYDEYSNQGLLDELWREYRNIAIADESKPFKNFVWYEPGDTMHMHVLKLIQDKQAFKCVIIDPARTANPNSDHSAIIGIVIDVNAGAVYAHSTFKERVDPTTLILEAFDMADALQTDLVFIEEDGLKLWATTVVRSVMLSRKKIYNVQPLSSGLKKKEDRIVKLVPLFKMGMVYLNAMTCKGLHAELSAFPRSKEDHLMDCLAYVVYILLNLDGWNYEDQGALAAAQDDVPYEDIPIEETDVDPSDWCVV